MFKNIIGKNLSLMLLIQFSFGLLGALIVHVFFERYTNPTIATVNISSLENSFIQETVKQNLPKIELSKKVSIFAQSINQTINNIAKRNHLTIVPSEAVIAGSIDLTGEVAKEVKRRVQNEFS